MTIGQIGQVGGAGLGRGAFGRFLAPDFAPVGKGEQDDAADDGQIGQVPDVPWACLLYTSDAADERSSVDLGGRRII